MNLIGAQLRQRQIIGATGALELDLLAHPPPLAGERRVRRVVQRVVRVRRRPPRLPAAGAGVPPGILLQLLGATQLVQVVEDNLRDAALLRLALRLEDARDVPQAAGALGAGALEGADGAAVDGEALEGPERSERWTRRGAGGEQAQSIAGSAGRGRALTAGSSSS